MRILLTADLHFQTDWYHWLSRQKADITVIAGDLLDGFRPDGLLPQMLAVSDWCERYPGPLAISSGNHDANTQCCRFKPEAMELIPIEKRETMMRMLTEKQWMDCLERPGLVTDGRTSVLETSGGALVVTTIPFDFGSTERQDQLWQEGSIQRASHRVPWIVAHHEPPANTMVGGRHGHSSLIYRIREYRPNFLVSGHMHAQPYRGSFADHVDGTWCLNPGHPSPSLLRFAHVPNHIVLDLGEFTATWYAASPTAPIIKRILLS